MKLFNDNEMYNKKLNTFELIMQIIKPILIYFIVTIVVTFFSSMIYATLNLDKVTDKNFENVFMTKYGLLITLISQIIALIILFFIYRKDKKTYPIVSKKCNKNMILYGGLFIMTVGIISGYLIDLITYLFPSFASGYEEVESMFNSGGFLVAFLSTCVFAPIVEEIMCRGLILNNLLSKKSIIFSIIVSSLIFGFMHMNMLQGVNAFILGVILAIVFIKTRNIYACILGHFLNNLIAVVSEYANFSILTYDILNVVLVLISIYPIIMFIKNDNVKIEKNDYVK